MTTADFADAVLIFAALTHASVTSWLRTPAHNSLVKGVQNSAHLYGLAADVVYDAPMPLSDVTERARRMELTLIRETDHDHLQPLGWDPG
jgi:hypothetical protein